MSEISQEQLEELRRYAKALMPDATLEYEYEPGPKPKLIDGNHKLRLKTNWGVAQQLVAAAEVRAFPASLLRLTVTHMVGWLDAL